MWKFLQANGHFIRTIWCSLPLFLLWEQRSHTSFFSTTPLVAVESVSFTCIRVRL